MLSTTLAGKSQLKKKKKKSDKNLSQKITSDHTSVENEALQKSQTMRVRLKGYMT